MDVMEWMAMLLFAAGCLLLLLRMFATGLLWGLSAVLFTVVAVPLFLVFHWPRARGPMGLWLLASLCALLVALK